MKLHSAIYSLPLIALSVLSACSTRSISYEKRLTEKRLTRLEKNLVRIKSQNEELREKNLVLNRRIQLMEAGDVAPLSPQPSLDAFQLTADQVLRRSIKDDLEKNHIAEAEHTLRLLEKSYPRSMALSEAKFDVALAFYRRRELQKAKPMFEAIRQEFPNSLEAKRAIQILGSVKDLSATSERTR